VEVVEVQYVLALAAAVVVGLLLWKLMSWHDTEDSERAEPSRARAPMMAPDDDPEFLRELGERLRREGEDPSGRR
jgi:hypothetical protein